MWSKFEFCEISASKFIAYLTQLSVRILHIYCPNWVKMGIMNLHIILSILYEFCENMDREDHTFVLDLKNYITLVVYGTSVRELGN